jgi:hypothetical protein
MPARPARPLAAASLALLVAGMGVAAPAAAPADAPAADVAPSTDLQLDVVALRPPPGSTLKANDPVVVTLRYRYARPAGDVMVWAKLLGAGPASYEGARADTPAGSGIIERTVTLNGPGEVHRLTLVAKDARLQQIYRREVPVHYTWVPNPRAEAIRDDGTGSRIVGVRLAPGTSAVLKAGTPVAVDLDVDNRSSRGVQAWVEPVTSCNMAFDDMLKVRAARGTVRQRFTVGQRCVVTQLHVALANSAGVRVFDQLVNVDLRYVD